MFAQPRPIPSGGVTHVVGGGENLESIAYLYGHTSAFIWSHERNAPLRALRDDPLVLFPGDSVFIPPLRKKVVEVGTGRTHTFTLRGVPSLLRFRARVGGHPLADMPYVVEVDGREHHGITDSQGALECRVRPDADVALVRVGSPPLEWTYRLDLRALHPVTEESGLRARLTNLGFLSSRDTQAPDALAGALRAFQAGQSLQSTGVADATTRERLRQLHGS